MDRRQVASESHQKYGFFQLAHDYSNQRCQSTNATWVNEKRYYDSTSRHEWTEVDSDQIEFGSMKDNGDFSFYKTLIIYRFFDLSYDSSEHKWFINIVWTTERKVLNYTRINKSELSQSYMRIYKNG